MSCPAVVLAGGLGRRLRSVSGDRYPKPLAPIPQGGVSYPFLEFPLAHLRSQGVTEIVICIGHLGEQIRRHFGDGSRFGIRINYDDAGPALTAARVRHAAHHIHALQFVVLCGDVYHPLDLGEFMTHFRQHPRWLMQLAVNMADTDLTPNVAMDKEGSVVAYDPQGVRAQGAGIETGTLALHQRVLQDFRAGPDTSLTADVYPELLAKGALGAFRTDTGFFDIGTPAGYHRFCAFVEGGDVLPLSRLG